MELRAKANVAQSPEQWAEITSLAAKIITGLAAAITKAGGPASGPIESGTLKIVMPVLLYVTKKYSTGLYVALVAVFFMNQRLQDSYPQGLFAERCYAILGDLALKAGWGYNSGTVQNPDIDPDWAPITSDALAAVTAVAAFKGKLEFRAYIAFTPSSLQFGIAGALQAQFYGFGIRGHLGLDVLIGFDGSFNVHLEFSVELLVGGHSLAAVRFTGSLVGYSPTVLSGKAEVQFLFWTLSVHGSITIHDSQLPDTSFDVTGTLASAITQPANRDTGGAPGVTLPDSKREGVWISPSEPLRLCQPVVPLNIPIERFGTARLKAPQTFRIEGVSARTTPLRTVPMMGEFALGMFLNLGQEEMLASRGFENREAGVEIVMPLEVGAAANVGNGFEELLRDPKKRPNVADPALTFSPVSVFIAQEAAVSPLSVQRERFAVIDNKPVAQVRARTFFEARASEAGAAHRAGLGGRGMNMNARFLPWARQSTFAGDALAVRVSGRAVSVPVSRYGPGDVLGVAAAQISRRDPAPGSISMPPNLFPSVEFNRSDLPWALSPGSPDASGRLQPWLALITADAPAGSPLSNVGDAKLPVIEVLRTELPAPAKIPLWAHVQVGASVGTTQDVIRAGVARILSPRALAPKRRYCACLVPTFEAGRLAGLGKPVPDARSTVAAWSSGPGTVLLPVYDSWFFTTAESEDLETIAQRLRGYDLSATSRPKQLDVSSVSGNVVGRLAPFEGALRPVGPVPEWKGPAVTASAKVLASELEHTPVGGVSVVGPPVYGSIASGQSKPIPGWLSDLNLDPRWRAAAGLGAQLVRQHQEDLVDEAWRQAGDIQRARREHAGAQLAEFAAAKLNSRMVAPLSGANALVTIAPALARMRDAGTVTVAPRVEASVLPGPVLGAAFRRIRAAKAPAASPQEGQGMPGTLREINAVPIIQPGALPFLSLNITTGRDLRLVLAKGSWGLPVRFLPGKTLAVPPRTIVAPAVAGPATIASKLGSAIRVLPAVEVATISPAAPPSTPPTPRGKGWSRCSAMRVLSTCAGFSPRPQMQAARWCSP